jgi:hypothetical protein
MHEPFEVERQAAALGAAVKPFGQLAGVGRRQASVFLLARQLDDGLRAKAAIEMIVKEDFGKGVDGDGCALASGRSYTLRIRGFAGHANSLTICDVLMVFLYCESGSSALRRAPGGTIDPFKEGVCD